MEQSVGCLHVQGQAEDRDGHIICRDDHSRDACGGEKDGSGPVWIVTLPVSHCCPPESPLARSSFCALPSATGPKRAWRRGREAGRSASWTECSLTKQLGEAGKGKGMLAWLAHWAETYKQPDKELQ